MSKNSRINPQPVSADEAYHRRMARAQDRVKDAEAPRIDQRLNPRGRTATKGQTKP